MQTPSSVSSEPGAGRPAFSQTGLVRGALLGNSFATAFPSPQRFKHAERHSERRWGALRPKRPGGAASLQGLEAVIATQRINSPQTPPPPSTPPTMISDKASP